jgi:hypothetical protein
MKKALFVIVLMLLVAVSKGQEIGDSYYVAVQKIKSGQNFDLFNYNFEQKVISIKYFDGCWALIYFKNNKVYKIERELFSTEEYIEKLKKAGYIELNTMTWLKREKNIIVYIKIINSYTVKILETTF